MDHATEVRLAQRSERGEWVGELGSVDRGLNGLGGCSVGLRWVEGRTISAISTAQQFEAA